jgi:hypothetical protein
MEELDPQHVDAVFLPPEETVQPEQTFLQTTPKRVRQTGGSGGPMLFGNTERELYATFYGAEKKEERTGSIHSRKCLFHGDEAAASCPECGSILCKQCVASGLCPRCHTPVRVKQLTSSSKKLKAQQNIEVDELELEKVDVEERQPAPAAEQRPAAEDEDSKERDWTRL